MKRLRAEPVLLARGLRVAFALLSSLAAAGCALIDRHEGLPLAIDSMSSATDGIHYSKVLEEYGPPEVITRLEGGMAFKYEYTRIVERQYGLVLPGDLGKWIKAVYARAEASGQRVIYTFDDNGRLNSTASGVWKSKAGSGFSFTFILSVGSLTDTSLYGDDFDATNLWGASLVQPVAKALNAGQSLDDGLHGFELTGTSQTVGQRTLETALGR